MRGNAMRLLRAFGFFVSTLAMYLAMPLIGWGLGHLPGFFSTTPRLAYALLVLALGLAVGWQTLRSPEGIRSGKGRDDKRVPRQSIIRIIVILMLYAGLLFVPFADRRNIGTLGLGPLIRWIGVLLFGLGSVLVFWSGVALGRLYSGDVTLQEDHRLVTNGPYRWIRHPRYTGGILLASGLSLTFDSWIGLLASLAFIGIVLFRIRDEEALMGEAFGPEWEAYCQRTARLIPFTY
jgi:protein-S-isoprenylcysteine O-methyltransferase Ste14